MSLERRSKRIPCDEAARLVRCGARVAIQGSGGGIGEPTALLRAVRRRFDDAGEPGGLTLLHATGLGDKREIGTDLLAVPGLVKRDVAGHLGMAPAMAEMIRRNQIESFNFPQGVMSQMFGAVAARKPGVFTKVGLGTYIDPRLEAGRMNDAARLAAQQDPAGTDYVRVTEIDGHEWLFFPAWHIDVALVRGTTADTNGNVSSEQEAAVLEGIKIAQAAKSCGGIVIAQVKYLAQAGSIDPRTVRIPGTCVDYVVVDPLQKQTTLHEYDPALCGASRMPLDALAPLPLDHRKVVARRAAAELFPGAVVNLGVGMPDGIASVAAERGLLDELTFTVEQGLIGGRPAGGVIFGASYNPQAIIAEDDQFGFYDGGNLDLAFLGMAQCDAEGNVNVSKVGSMLSGCGGFINISQNAKRVVFCGTMTAKGFSCTAADGKLRIEREGSIRKFVERVEQVTFSGRRAREAGQAVLFVTERAVFSLRPEGVVLEEVAPGVDIERDVLQQMAFRPHVLPDLRQMNPDIFHEAERAANGSASYGSASHRRDMTTSNGTAPNGTAPNGTAPNGTAPNGTAANGQAEVACAR